MTTTLSLLLMATGAAQAQQVEALSHGTWTTWDDDGYLDTDEAFVEVVTLWDGYGDDICEPTGCALDAVTTPLQLLEDAGYSYLAYAEDLAWLSDWTTSDFYYADAADFAIMYTHGGKELGNFNTYGNRPTIHWAQDTTFNGDLDVFSLQSCKVFMLGTPPDIRGGGGSPDGGQLFHDHMRGEGIRLVTGFQTNSYSQMGFLDQYLEELVVNQNSFVDAWMLSSIDTFDGWGVEGAYIQFYYSGDPEAYVGDGLATRMDYDPIGAAYTDSDTVYFLADSSWWDPYSPWTPAFP